MPHLAELLDELERSPPAQAAVAMLENSLARRSVVEQRDFWRAVAIAYVSRRAPTSTTAPAEEVARVDRAHASP